LSEVIPAKRKKRAAFFVSREKERGQLSAVKVHIPSQHSLALSSVFWSDMPKTQAFYFLRKCINEKVQRCLCLCVCVCV